MDDRTRKELASRLACLDTNERHKLYKRAALLRKTTRKDPRPKRTTLDWDEDESAAPRKPSASLDDLVLRILEQEELPSTTGSGPRVEGTVVWVGQKVCRVRIDGEDVQCEICGDLARTQQTTVAVGDLASVEREGDVSTVRAVLPRRSKLSRPDPDNAHRERVIAANVDLVVITVSIKSPPLHPRLIDRYLVAVQKGGAEAALCVNKLDLAADEVDLQAELDKLAPYRCRGRLCDELLHDETGGVHRPLEAHRGPDLRVRRA